MVEASKRWPLPASTCWKTLIWALIGAILLALLQPSGQVNRVSGFEQQSLADMPATLASDEFRDTVLATMSTQSPINGGEEQPPMAPPPPLTNSGNNSRDLLDQALAQSAAFQDQPDWLERVLTFCRIFVMGAIIVGDICGNSLVILSVCRHSKLRVTTNWFVVSLACADILVALFAMTFNASVIISGRWLFKPWVCDFWNSCDVLASTASILHLCCISIDRYIAITRPLDYPMKITTRRVVYALCAVWISSALLSYIPIFTGVYTTAEHIKWLEDNPDQCDFVVNRVYAVVSSSISFWIPSSIMVCTYWRIYKEATRQEKFIYKAQSMMPAPMSNHHSSSSHSQAASKQRRSKSMAFSSSGPGAAHSSNEARIRQLARQQHELQPPASAAAPATTGGNRQLATSGGGGCGPSSLVVKQTSSNNDLLPNNESNIATTELSQPVSISERASSLLQLAQRTDSSTGSPGAGAETDPLTTAPIQRDKTQDSSNNLTVAERQTVAKVPAPPAKPGNNRRRPNGARTTTFADEEDDEDDDRDSNSGQSTPTNRSISKMKREHKAAKTLGIIMGVFILCWLPFFSWYTPQHLCGQACGEIVPRGAVTILFWIGYFNSTLNPIIYAYFNHEFRDAFKKTLQWIFCCCNDLKCLRVNRPNDNQHYNCTYRSTQEIGLVSNS